MIPDDIHQEIEEVVCYDYESPRVHVADRHQSSVIDVMASGTYEMPDGTEWAWCITSGPGAHVHQWAPAAEPMNVQPPDRGPTVAAPRFGSSDPWTWADAVVQTRAKGPAVQALYDAAYDSYHAPGGQGFKVPADHPLRLERLNDIPDRWRPLYDKETAGEVWAREVLRPGLDRLAAAVSALENLPPRPPAPDTGIGWEPTASEMFDAAFAFAVHATHGNTERRAVASARDAVARASAMYLDLTGGDYVGLRAAVSP